MAVQLAVQVNAIKTNLETIQSTWQCDSMKEREVGKLTQHSSNSWNYLKHASQVSHGTKHLSAFTRYMAYLLIHLLTLSTQKTSQAGKLFNPVTLYYQQLEVIKNCDSESFSPDFSRVLLHCFKES